MAYSFMEIYKIKTSGQMTSKCNHNCRKVEIDNVIKELIDMNDELISLPKDKNGNEMDYNQAFRTRIHELDYYQTHKIRKNAVRGFEVLMTFSKDEGIDIDEWEKKSVEWLHKTFDVVPDGKSNVLHAVCHKDEPGNVHIHAFVVPIDERGKLNATRWTDGSRSMSDLQTTYADAVADLGLERGLKGSSAKHKDIRKWYAELNRNIESIPKAEPGESGEHYRQRVLEILQEQRAVDARERYEFEQKIRRKMDQDKTLQYEAIKHEFEQSQIRAKEELNSIYRDIHAAENKISSIETEITDKTSELETIKKEIRDDRHMMSNAEKYERLSGGLAYLQSYDIERAAAILESLDYVDQVYEEHIKNLSVETQAETNEEENLE